MALEWAILTYAVAAEAIILLLVTMPGVERIRKGVIVVSRNALQPLLAIVPFCLFLLLDIYWKYENLPPICDGPSCTVAEQTKHAKSVMKSQRNAILVLAALLLYWLLYCVTHMLVEQEKLHQQVKQLKQRKVE